MWLILGDDTYHASFMIYKKYGFCNDQSSYACVSVL